MPSKKTSPQQKFALFQKLIGAAAGILFLLILTLCIFEMDETVTAAGRVEPADDFEIRSPLDGRVKEVLFWPGDTVPAGAAVILLDRRDHDERFNNIERLILDLEAQLDSQSQERIFRSSPPPKAARHPG